MYLPAGTDWYNFWTNERVHGGQTAARGCADRYDSDLCARGVDRADGSAGAESTEEKQAIAEVRVYPGANGEFTLYNDDGKSYAYEQGKSEITHLKWNDASGRLTHTGASSWNVPDAEIVKVVR